MNDGIIDEKSQDHQQKDSAGFVVEFVGEDEQQRERGRRHHVDVEIVAQADSQRLDDGRAAEDHRKVGDVGTDDVPDGKVGVALFERDEGDDQLRQRGPQRDEQQADEPFADAEHPCDGAAAFDDVVRSADRQGKSGAEQQERFAPAEGFLFQFLVHFVGKVGAVFGKEKDQVCDHQHQKDEAFDGADPSVVGHQKKEDHGKQDPGAVLVEKITFRRKPFRQKKDGAQHQCDVEGDASDDVGDGHVGFAVPGGHHRRGHFRQGGAEPDQRRPDDEAGDVVVQGDALGFADDEIRAVDQCRHRGDENDEFHYFPSPSVRTIRLCGKPRASMISCSFRRISPSSVSWS